MVRKACHILEERAEQTALRGIARPLEAISSPVSSSVRLSFSRVKISNIKHDRYFPHALGRQKTYENSSAHVASEQAPKWGIGRRQKSSSERGAIPHSARPARRFFFSPYTPLGSLFTGTAHAMKQLS